MTLIISLCFNSEHSLLVPLPVNFEMPVWCWQNCWRSMVIEFILLIICHIWCYFKNNLYFFPTVNWLCILTMFGFALWCKILQWSKKNYFLKRRKFSCTIYNVFFSFVTIQNLIAFLKGQSLYAYIWFYRKICFIGLT